MEAGAGKSILAQAPNNQTSTPSCTTIYYIRASPTIIDKMQHLCLFLTQTWKIAAAFIYRVVNNEETRNIRAILGSLASQIFQRIPAASQSIVDHQRVKLGTNIHSQLVPPDQDALVKIIVRGFHVLAPIILIIDGLDECPGKGSPFVQMEITSELLSLYQNTEGSMKILVTSRDDYILRQNFQCLPSMWLTDYTHQDVKLVVDGFIVEQKESTTRRISMKCCRGCEMQY